MPMSVLDLIGTFLGDLTSAASAAVSIVEEYGKPQYTICDLCQAAEALKREDGEKIVELSRKVARNIGPGAYDAVVNNPQGIEQMFSFLITQWKANEDVITKEQYDNCIDLNY